MSQPTAGSSGGGPSNGATDVSTLTGGTTGNNQAQRQSSSGHTGGGRFTRRGGRGGRGRGGNHTTTSPPKRKKFQGCIECLNGKEAVFELKGSPGESGKVFIKARREICHYISGSESGYRCGYDIKQYLLNDGRDEPVRPEVPGPAADQFERDAYAERVKRWMSKAEEMKYEIKKACSDLLGQCDDDVIEQLEALPNHTQVVAEGRA